MVQLLNKPFETVVNEVADRVEALNPIDRQSQMQKLAFKRDNDARSWVIEPMQSHEGVQVVPTMHLSDYALRQFINLVGYKTDLLETLPPSFVFNDVNYLMQYAQAEKQAFIRLIHGDHTRAVLGGRFTPMDDLELLEICGDYLQDATVRFHSIGELTSHITVTFPGETREDGIEPGLHIANSEVGARAITIQAVLFRRICANVLPRVDMGGSDFGIGKGGKLYTRGSGGDSHYGNARSGIVESGWRFIHQGDPNRLRAFVSDAISDVRSSHELMIERWRIGLQTRIDDAAKAIETISKGNGLTQEQMRAVLNAHAEEREVSGGDFANTVTGVVNGFTRAANGQEDAEDRYKLQVAGASGFIYLN